MDKLRFERMWEGDIAPLTRIMKRAFDEDARIHLGRPVGGSPGYDDGSFLRKWGLNPKATPYKIYGGEVLIGGAIVWINPSNENFLGCLFVDPLYENKGFGTRIWERLEAMYPETKAWNTETPIFSHRNHNFYINKCGFRLIRIENPKDLENGSFILRKEMGRRG